MPNEGYNKSIDFTAFRSNLKMLSETNHTTMQDVSKGIGASNVTLSRYIHGFRTPDLEMVARLSTYFSVSMDWLLGLSDTQDTIQTDDNTLSLVKRYNLASNEDKKVIDLILKKYEVGE